MYDDEFLYIAVAVIDYEMVQRLDAGSEDGATWNEDSAEIFIDGNHNAVEGNVNDHPEEYETGGQFVLTSAGARRDKEAGDPTFGDGPEDEWYGSVWDNENFDGFNYEFRVKLSKIGNPQKGDTIGFNLAVNDADDSSASGSDYQMRWTGLAHDESTYGDLYFGRREITIPLISEAVTINGQKDESVWDQAAHGRISAQEGTTGRTYYPRDMDDLSCDFYLFHDEDFIYALVDVRDNIIRADTEPPKTDEAAFWHDDSVEFMLDSDYSQNDGNNVGYGASGKFSMTANGARRAVALGDFLFGTEAESDWHAEHTASDDGFIIEYRIAKGAVLNPLDIELIGFNIAVNDDDNDDVGPGDRDIQMTWNGYANEERSYGALIFGGPPVAADDWILF